MKDTENRPRTTIVTRKGDEADGLCPVRRYCHRSRADLFF